MPQAVATRVELDEHGRVSGITYQTYDDEDTAPASSPRTARGKVYVLAANAIENAALLLASGAANSSGMVGRNLMDHPLILTWGLMPEPVWGFRGPLSTSGLEMFRDGPFRTQTSAFRIEVGNEGVEFLGQRADVDGADPGQAGRFWCRAAAHDRRGDPRQFRLGLEMEQIPEASNYVTIDRDYRDQLGAFRPVIRYDLPDYVRSGFAMAKEASDAMYSLLGVHPLGPDADRDAFPYPGDYTSYKPTDQAPTPRRTRSSRASCSKRCCTWRWPPTC